MWTYRPAESTPTPQKREIHPTAANTVLSRSQPSTASPRSQNEHQGVWGHEPHISGVQPSLRQSGPAPWQSYELSGPLRTGQNPKNRPSKALYTARWMGCLYLIGLAAGSLCSRVLSGPLLTYVRYFASIDLGLRTTGNAAMVFSVGFLSLFCQLTLMLIAGFCVLGIGLIPVTMVLKGAGTGVFIALLYQQLGTAKGLLLQALVFWLPETLGSLLVILLSASALQVSAGLLRCCLGQGQNSPGAASRRLVHRYLTICFVSMLVCGLSVLLTLLFGSLF